jgi:hypothetical protein
MFWLFLFVLVGCRPKHCLLVQEIILQDKTISISELVNQVADPLKKIGNFEILYSLSSLPFSG